MNMSGEFVGERNVMCTALKNTLGRQEFQDDGVVGTVVT